MFRNPNVNFTTMMFFALVGVFTVGWLIGSMILFFVGRLIVG